VRVRIEPETRDAWLVAYLPSEILSCTDAASELESLSRKVPSIRLERISCT